MHRPCARVQDLQFSAVGQDHPSSHKAVVAFSKEMQLAGHSPEHLWEEEACGNQSRPLGRVGNGPWEAAGSRCVAGGSHTAVSAALAVGEMHWAVLLP